ncbi:hypothetical protein O3P69_011511 [Scylla paramamosain]|uniref:Uncharacterized protein n=1 Tax=Scylla paramamosain TaxID=85552 RepID=A0AAW0T6H0_SCYPA
MFETLPLQVKDEERNALTKIRRARFGSAHILSTIKANDASLQGLMSGRAKWMVSTASAGCPPWLVLLPHHRI